MKNEKDFSMFDLFAELTSKLTLIDERLERIERKLETAPETLKEVLTADETARYIQVSKSHLYKLTCANKIPFYKPNGKKLYFKRSELDEYLIQDRYQCKNEIEQKANEYLMKNPRKRF